jgi:hypothetical protein
MMGWVTLIDVSDDDLFLGLASCQPYRSRQTVTRPSRWGQGSHPIILPRRGWGGITWGPRPKTWLGSGADTDTDIGQRGSARRPLLPRVPCIRGHRPWPQSRQRRTTTAYCPMDLGSLTPTQARTLTSIPTLDLVWHHGWNSTSMMRCILFLHVVFGCHNQIIFWEI